jgi:hypothetical protein
MAVRRGHRSAGQAASDVLGDRILLRRLKDALGITTAASRPNAADFPSHVEGGRSLEHQGNRRAVPRVLAVTSDAAGGDIARIDAGR